MLQKLSVTPNKPIVFKILIMEMEDYSEEYLVFSRIN